LYRSTFIRNIYIGRCTVYTTSKCKQKYSEAKYGRSSYVIWMYDAGWPPAGASRVAASVLSQAMSRIWSVSSGGSQKLKVIKKLI
jgi:hypothetical protein